MIELRKIKTWAVSKYDLEEAWFAYTRRKDGIPDSFAYAFCKGWLAARNLNPDYNVVEITY